MSLLISPSPLTPYTDIRAASTSIRAQIWRALPVAITLLAVLVLATFNLEYFPRTWYDEGMNLEVAKNLASLGRYVQSPETPQAFDTAASSGPTVIVPIAVTFKLFGVGLVQARLVMVLYIVLAAMGIYAVAIQLYGRTVGVIAVLAFASIGPAGPFVNGRDAVGEIPAMAFLLWGVAAFIRASEARAAGLHVLSGLLLGAAILTKNQFILIVPALLLTWALTRPRTDRWSLRRLIVLLAAVALPMIGWEALQLTLLGPQQFLEQWHQLLLAATPSGASTLHRALSSVKFLLTSGFAVSGAVGLLYVLLLGFQKSTRQPERLLLPIFATVWLVWYVCASIGWPRYAVPVVDTAGLFVAKLYYDLIRHYTPLRFTSIRNLFRGWQDSPLGFTLLIALSALLLSGIVTNGAAIVEARDRSPQQFASQVEAQVPATAAVESYEWEIIFLTNRTYHHPPVSIMVEATEYVFLEGSPEELAQYEVPVTATYLVDGPFSKLAGLYRQTLARGAFVPIATVGEYDLYRRVTVAP